MEDFYETTAHVLDDIDLHTVGIRVELRSGQTVHISINRRDLEAHDETAHVSFKAADTTAEDDLFNELVGM